MTDKEIIYKAISEVVNTDNPSSFAAHHSTCYIIAKYVCEELRKELNNLPAEQPMSDYLQAREKISSYLYNLIFDQAHRGAPMLQHGDRRINEEVDLILKMAIRELDKKVPSEQLNKDLDVEINLEYKSNYKLKELSPEEFREIAHHFTQWQKKQIINKACQWLQHNAEKYVAGYGFPNYQTGLLLHDFKHAMEDKQCSTE